MPRTRDPDSPHDSPITSPIPSAPQTPRPSPNHPIPSPFNTTPTQNGNQPPTGNGGGEDYAESPTPGPPYGDPRTTSSNGDGKKDTPQVPKTPSAADVAKTLGSLLVVLAGLAGWLAARSGRDLRPPDEDERAEVAEPVAAILLRHAGAAFLTEDLVDGIRATAGVAGYVQTSPLSPSPRKRRGQFEVPADMEPTNHVSDLEPI